MATVFNGLSFLQQRNSMPKLTGPGPDAAELEQMLQCALRSPDHARLRPWRFISIQGDRRKDFGELLRASLLRRDPDADDAAQEKARNAPLRAPLVIAVLVSLKEHPKVPAWEQRISAGCAAFSLILAAEALNYGAIWRTGAVAEDKQLLRDLGGADNEEFVGFIYVGRPDCNAKPVPTMVSEEFHRAW
ncbi:nitroreductase family protein [Congregibacter litoralis]|uniref:Putative NAD(P)H nitroreductase n=1 Tax=Congregibacter litoralis KT71 TaxID=314285 RepID=A4A7R4_9GAMM|nr:nitroreductase [Congregibacter litoralis]EAQ97709.1 Nitroreductase [Congregibacter litoralis KT71]